MKLRVLPTGVPWIQEAQTCFFDQFSPSSSQRRFLVSATFSREQGTWIWKNLKVSEKMGKCGQRKGLGVRSPRGIPGALASPSNSLCSAEQVSFPL